jgi:Protein of unknown function (DUF1778)
VTTDDLGRLRVIEDRLARKKRAKPGGGNRMMELGYKPVQVWLDREEYAAISQAAALDSRPMTRFVVLAALAAAREMIRNRQANEGDK